MSASGNREGKEEKKEVEKSPVPQSSDQLLQIKLKELETIKKRHVDTLIQMGEICHKKHDIDSALKHYMAAIELGSGLAAQRAGMIMKREAERMVDMQEDATRNEDERLALLRGSERLIRKAAELGDALGQYQLYELLKNSIEQNILSEVEKKARRDEAERWLLKAANQGQKNARSTAGGIMHNDYITNLAHYTAADGTEKYELDIKTEKDSEKLEKLCHYCSIFASRNNVKDRTFYLLNLVAIEYPNVFDKFIETLAKEGQFEKIDRIFNECLSDEAAKLVAARLNSDIRDRFIVHKDKMAAVILSDVVTEDQIIFKQHGIVELIGDYATSVEVSENAFLQQAFLIFEKHLMPFKENQKVKELLDNINDLKKNFSWVTKNNLSEEIERIINSQSSSSSMFSPLPSPIVQALIDAKKEIEKHQSDVFNFLFPSKNPNFIHGPRS